MSRLNSAERNLRPDKSKEHAEEMLDASRFCPKIWGVPGARAQKGLTEDGCWFGGQSASSFSSRKGFCACSTQTNEAHAAARTEEPRL